MRQFIDHSLLGGDTGDECTHISLIDDNGVSICADCGEEVDAFSYQQEKKNYSGVNNRSAKDNSRCRTARTVESPVLTVFKECNIQISPALVNLVQAKYDAVLEHERQERKKEFGVDGKIVVRGKCRKGLVAACRWKIYEDKERRPEEGNFIKMFKITSQIFEKGRDRYERAFPKEPIENTTSKDILKLWMKKTGVDLRYYKEISQLNDRFHRSSIKFMTSRPQSIAGAIIWYWLQNNPDYKEKLNITKSDFAKTIGLSDITIKKLVDEANRISTTVITE